MIVVVGRPAASRSAGGIVPGALPAAIALAAAEEGAAVEVVGTIGDDDTGDALTVALGRRGVGHAALLRVAGAKTASRDDAARPRLDAADVDLGLRYLTTISVLVVAEPLPPDVIRVVTEAAAYHGAHLIAIAAPGAEADAALAATDATVLVGPGDDVGAFARLIARYAIALADGSAPGAAFASARSATGWEARV